MKKNILLFLLSFVFVMPPHIGVAGDYAEAGKYLNACHSFTKALYAEKDKAKQEELIKKISEAADILEAEVKKVGKAKESTKEEKALNKEISELLEVFRKTRETELIPLYQAGETEKFKEVRMGEQNTRWLKLKELLK